MGVLWWVAGRRRSSEPSQVICEEGQQEAADVPVDDDGGEAQDTPGPWQHLGVWKTRWSQKLPPMCLLSPMCHQAPLPSDTGCPCQAGLPSAGSPCTGATGPEWQKRDGSCHAGPRASRPFVRAEAWRGQRWVPCSRPHKGQSPAAPCLPSGAVIPRPLGVVGLRTGAPHSLFFPCPARWVLPLSHCAGEETEAQGGQGTRCLGLARQHPPGGQQ